MMALAESLITFGERLKASIKDAVNMPERIGKIHPFFASIRANRTAEQLINVRVCFVEKRNEVGLGRSLLLHEEVKL